MARRYLGSVLMSSGYVPSSTRKSGMWGLEEFNQIQASTSWYPTQPALTASTFSTVNAASYSFASQAIGDAGPNSKTVYVMAAGSSAADIANMTIGGVAAVRMATGAAIVGGFHMSLWAARIDSATTTATIVTSYGGGAQGRQHIHVYVSSGVDYPLTALVSTSTTNSGASSAFSINLTLEPGMFALTGYYNNALGTTIGFTAGATLARRTTSAESGEFATAVTNWTTTRRVNHSITTTQTTGNDRAIFAVGIR